MRVVNVEELTFVARRGVWQMGGMVLVAHFHYSINHTRFELRPINFQTNDTAI